MSASLSNGAKAKISEAVAAVNEATAAAASRGGQAASTAVEAAATQASNGLHATQTKVSEGMQKAMKTAEEWVAFSQGNVEAVLKSGQIWASGMQDISKQVAASAQASFDQTLSTFRALAGTRSLKDAVDLQANLARSTIEKTLADSGRLTDASIKLAEQTIAPLTARVTLAVEKFARSA